MKTKDIRKGDILKWRHYEGFDGYETNKVKVVEVHSDHLIVKVLELNINAWLDLDQIEDELFR